MLVFQEGGICDCVPGGRGVVRRHLDVLLAGNSRPLPDEVVCGHGRRHTALTQRCVFFKNIGVGSDVFCLDSLYLRATCITYVFYVPFQY